MNTEVLASINDISAERWNYIVGRNRLICRHEYLRAVEASEINDCRYFYPVVFDGDEIVAHACLYYISTELDALAKGVGKTLVSSTYKWEQPKRDQIAAMIDTTPFYKSPVSRPRFLSINEVMMWGIILSTLILLFALNIWIKRRSFSKGQIPVE